MKKKQLRKRGTNKGKPKQNNRHNYGKGHGKIGKKADRIKRMIERQSGKDVVPDPTFQTPIKVIP